MDSLRLYLRGTVTLVHVSEFDVYCACPLFFGGRAAVDGIREPNRYLYGI